MSQNSIIDQYYSRHFPFKEVLSEIGGTVESTANELDNFIDFCEFLNDVNLEKPTILISLDDNFYADCYKEGKIEIISFTKGVYTTLEKLSYILLGNNLFLPHIGNIELEEDLDPFCNEIPIDLSQIKSEIQLPKCPKRREYADLLHKISFFYVISHELAHIRRGHFELLSDTKTISEKFIKTNASKKVKEMIEIDADSIAIDLILIYLQQLNKEHPNIWIIDSNENRVEFLSILIELISLIFFEDTSWIYDPNNNDNYPPAFGRENNLQSHLFYRAVNNCNLQPEKMIEIYQKIAKNFHLIYEKLFSEERFNLRVLQVSVYFEKKSDYLSKIQLERQDMINLLGNSVIYKHSNI